MKARKHQFFRFWLTSQKNPKSKDIFDIAGRVLPETAVKERMDQESWLSLKLSIICNLCDTVCYKHLNKIKHFKRLLLYVVTFNMQNTTITNLNKLILHRAVKKNWLYGLCKMTLDSLQNMSFTRSRRLVWKFWLWWSNARKNSKSTSSGKCIPLIFSRILCSAWAW